MKNLKIPDSTHRKIKTLAKKRKMKIEGLGEILLEKALSIKNGELK